MFKWEARKGWDILLRAYCEEFAPEEDVALVLHTYLYGDAEPRNTAKIEQTILHFLQQENLVRQRHADVDGTPFRSYGRPLHPKKEVCFTRFETKYELVSRRRCRLWVFR